MKPDLNKYREVIDTVEMKTSDGGRIRVEMDGLGSIEVLPWSSERDHEPDDIETDIGTYQDRVIFSPANGHDVQVLKFLAEHAAERYAAIMAEQEEHERNNQPQAQQPSLAIVEVA
jgi:hypothetical protein